MEFTEAISSGFRKYGDFSSRSRRSEYWYWSLFVFLSSIILAIVDELTTGFLLGTVFSLVTLLPGLAVSIRRLHDIDRTGWWLLIVLIPIIGTIILIVWFVKRGDEGNNRFGANPLQASTA